MAADAQNPYQPPPERPVAGALANAGAFLILTVGDALTKIVTQDLPPPQVVSVRCLFLLAMMTPYFIAASRRGKPLVATRRAGLHLTRVLFQFLSIVTGFLALRELPLTTAATISLVAPIFIAVAAIPILGERIRPPQIVAIAFGIVGCAIILRPSGDAQTFYMALAVVSSALWSVSMVILRLLTRTEDTPAIFIWSNAGVMLIAFAFALADWRPVSLATLGLIFCMAATQTAGQWLSLFAFRVAPAATVAPVQYTQIVWATLVGAIVFGGWPAPTVWFGAGFIIAGGIFLMRSGARRA